LFATETWLNNDIPNNLLDPESKYNIFRCNRHVSRGGGVCIFVSKCLKCSQVTGISEAGFEAIAVDVFCTASRCRFINVYRKPLYDSCGADHMLKLTDWLNSLCNVRWPVVITGDLNCNGISWSTLSAPADSIQDTFLDFVCSSGYDQMVTDPTRNDNILDIVLTSHPLSISNLQVIEPFSTSDHNSVVFSVDISPKCYNCVYDSDSAHKSYDWRRANCEAFSSYLSSVDWDHFMSVNLTAESIWINFKQIFFSAADLFVPCYTNRTRGLTAKAVRKYPSKIRKLFSRKKLLWRACRAQPNNIHLKNRYRQTLAECSRLLRKHELEHEQRIIESGSPGSFYRYVNSKLSCSSGVGCLFDRNGLPLTHDISKANVLNEYFASVCINDDGKLPPLSRRVPASASLDNIHFDTRTVLKVIRKIRPKLSQGPDRIPPYIIKNLGSSIAYPLARFFESFMSVGQVPSEWKSAIVTPIFKKGSSSDCSNYRPVSLCCSIQKIMERIIVCEMLTYLRKHNAITKEQHGFLSRRSTVSNLLETTNDWTISLKNKHMITAIYFDYSKAFDTVSHPKLFHKLSKYGFGGNLLTWIKQLLTSRIQYTRVGRSMSDSAQLCSGVVQGSCLGPLLFLLYVNDVTSVISDKCKCKLYADDLKLYSEISVVDDCCVLQDVIDKVKLWSDEWQLSMSVRKCAAICVGHFTNNLAAYKYTLGHNSLPLKDHVADLGVIVDPTMKYSIHIDQLVAKAKSRIGLLFRCFVTRDMNVLRQAFITYIRPLVEYASSVWSPTQVGLIDKLESVQRQFTKRIPVLYDLSYSDRLSALNLDSLELRRLRADLYLLYKIIFGMCDIDSNSLLSLRGDTVTRGHRYKIIQEHCVNNYRKNFFVQRVAPIWNSLPPSIVDFSSFSRFRRSINNVNLSTFTRF